MAVNYSIQNTGFDQYYVPTSYINQFVLTGTFWNWGANDYGQLGNNNAIAQSSPVQTVSSGTNWSISSTSGGRMALAVKTDGTLWGWGFNANGQLGNNNTISPLSSPVQTISGGSNWRSVTSGYGFTASVKQTGQLWTWGTNSNGQLGIWPDAIGGYSSPIQTTLAGTNWVQAAGGYRSTMAIKTDGTLWGFGQNTTGQLGLGSLVDQYLPAQVGTTIWSQVAISSRSVAALKSDGTLWGWGRNNAGQCGTGDLTFSYESPVQTISGGTNWRQVSAGGYNTGGIKTDGTLWMWGSGNLGNNTTNSASSPVQTISGGTTWAFLSIALTLNGNSVAAVKTDGTLWTWGRNNYGQLGDNTTIDKSSPIQTVAGGTNWSQTPGAIKAGATSLAVKTDGTLWTWGYGGNGSLGDNTTNTNKPSPVQTVAGGTNWSKVSTSSYSGANGAIKTDGTLWTWGQNSSGQLGDGTSISKSSPQQTSSAGTTWSQITFGQNATQATKTDGTLWMWGSNTFNQLGDNTTVSKLTPTQVGLPATGAGTDWGTVAISFNNLCSCAIKTNGQLYMWGNGSNGELTPAVPSGSSPYPAALPAINSSNWFQVSMASPTSTGLHAAAVKTDGTLWLWGKNTQGQLGDNTTVNKSTPVQTISGGNNWKQVSCGLLHTAAIKMDNTLWTWGDNATYGALGNNTTISTSSPIQTISGGNNWRQVSGGRLWTGAVKTNGTMWTWGYNIGGQLGDNTAIARSSPVQTINSASGNWKQIVCGATTTQGVYYYDAYNLYPAG